MTAIAGLVQDGRVWMGGDSAGVAGYGLQVRADPKVFHLGDMLIGYTTSFRMAQIIRFHVTPTTPKEGQDAFEYMIQEFVPSVREAMKAHGYLKTESGRETGGTFLLGWRGKLYAIEEDFQVAENACSYAACGCGRDLVLGSLHTTEQFELDGRTRIRMALETAEMFSAGVRGPFIVKSISGAS